MVQFGMEFLMKFFARSSRKTKGAKTTESDLENGVEPSGEKEPETAKSDKDVNEGERLEVKRLDEVYDRRRGEWTKTDTVNRRSRTKPDAHAEYVFTVIRKFNPTDDPTLHDITTTYDIRSRHLRKVGKDIVGNVLGISWNARPLKIDPQSFVAYLPKLDEHLQLLKSKNDGSDATLTQSDAALEREHLEFFVKFVKSEHASLLEEIKALLTHGEITFKLAWALFVPGTILYTACPVSGTPRAVRLVRMDSTMQGWALEVEYVEYKPNAKGMDEHFGFATLTCIAIPKFQGAVKITSLPAYPMSFCKFKEELKTKLIERAKKWCSLQGTHHMYYNAKGYQKGQTKYLKIKVNSRIMVDLNTFQDTVPNYQLPSVNKTLRGEYLDPYTQSSAAPLEELEASGDGNESAVVPNWESLTEEQLLLASPLVYGFSLTDKLWLEFTVDDVKHFEWDDEPFTNLVLPRDQKQVVLSLVEAHSQGISRGFDDFVKGKGQGLVVNLFGNPGVGKSLTAEATSEHVRKPLYVVGAGDLGLSSEELDSNLTRIFSISSKWGAVVLIDEADVFLEERSFRDLHRNAMVSVFLRQLEYFKGILFLTTNRVRTFDEAFQSRIHVSLRYSDLSADAKRQIWVAFLRKARQLPTIPGDTEGEKERLKALKETAATVDLSMDELRELGEKDINGRQIKNVVRTAGVLATSRKESLGYKHLMKVLDMMEQFDASHTMYQ